jgi:hypothetical protein
MAVALVLPLIGLALLIDIGLTPPQEPARATPFTPRVGQPDHWLLLVIFEILVAFLIVGEAACLYGLLYAPTIVEVMLAEVAAGATGTAVLSRVQRRTLSEFSNMPIPQQTIFATFFLLLKFGALAWAISAVYRQAGTAISP